MSACHLLGCDVAAGAGSVLESRVLLEVFLQPLRNQSRGGLGWTTRCKADDNANSLVGGRIRGGEGGGKLGCADDRTVITGGVKFKRAAWPLERGWAAKITRHLQTISPVELYRR
jgi:hypothetical protein